MHSIKPSSEGRIIQNKMFYVNSKVWKDYLCLCSWYLMWLVLDMYRLVMWWLAISRLRCFLLRLEVQTQCWAIEVHSSNGLHCLCSWNHPHVEKIWGMSRNSLDTPCIQLYMLVIRTNSWKQFFFSSCGLFYNAVSNSACVIWKYWLISE
jgi:hypothetical protein